jgi:predicted LPLAT superfamily acyltransferase
MTPGMTPGIKPDTASPPAATSWAAKRERGNLLALRFMAWVATRLGPLSRPIARWLLHPITLYYLCMAHSARRHSARYLGRALGRPVTWADRYRHMHSFASTVLDRVYFVRGQSQVFDVQMHGDAGCHDTIAAQQGGFLLGAHLGSFESLHAAGKSFPGMQVTLVMYPDNARQIQAALQALAPDLKMAVIAIGNPGSTLAIRDALDAGHLVGLLGDRMLAEDAQAAAARSARSSVVNIPFLGQPARFSDGPLRLAMLLKRRVLFMVGLYRGGKRYDVRFETLADFRQPPADAAARERLILDTLGAYVARLESLCREAPYNWFNFYDFWQEDRAQTFNVSA